MPDRKRILLVEDHVLVSEAVSMLLSSRPPLEVAGAAPNVRVARRRLSELEPDIVIVDLLLGDGDAIELLRFIRDEHARARTIVLTCVRDAFAANEAFAAGAAAYVLKMQPFEDLLAALEAVIAGRSYVSPLIADRLQSLRSSSPDRPGLDKLSHREREILGLIVGGLTSGEIAQRLSISTKTIDTHRSNMYRKLGLRNAADLVRFATFRGMGMGAPGD